MAKKNHNNFSKAATLCALLDKVTMNHTLFKNYLLPLFLCIAVYFPLQANDHLVLVSVAPYVTMIKELTNDQVEVQLLVPAGYSSHTFEPTPRQIIKASSARLWFTIGELFEIKAAKALQSENPKLQTIDLRQGLSLLDDACHHHGKNHGSADPHIWMSPKMMQPQVRLMAKELQKTFPALSAEIETRLEQLIVKLQTLDKKIQEQLVTKRGDTIFVSHPAYGYFCREYDLKQISIEHEGKDHSPKQLTELIQLAKELEVKTVFVQKQYSTKAAELVAAEVGATTVVLDPYAENYFENMLYIASAFAKELA